MNRPDRTSACSGSDAAGQPGTVRKEPESTLSESVSSRRVEPILELSCHGGKLIVFACGGMDAVGIGWGSWKKSECARPGGGITAEMLLELGGTAHYH